MNKKLSFANLRNIESIKEKNQRTPIRERHQNMANIGTSTNNKMEMQTTRNYSIQS